MRPISPSAARVIAPGKPQPMPITVQPARLDFGDVPVTQPFGKTLQLEVSNTGAAPLSVHVTLTESAADAFHLPSVRSLGPDHLNEGVFDLAAGETRKLPVMFVPQSRSITGNLRLDVDGARRDVPLSGTGVLPPLAPSPR